MEPRIFFLLSILVLYCPSSEGSRIVFPDELPSLIDKLEITDKIRTRFNFPSNQDSCTTETGATGQCLPLNKCPELLNYIQARNGISSRQDISFLRGRICRFLVNNVNLCCVVKTSPILNNSTRSTNRVSLPTEDECGFTLVSKITDGVEYRHGVHPWLVGVGYPTDTGAFRVLCGGTLITKRHVITAAHCFIRFPGLRELTHVTLGEHSLSRNTEDEPPIILLIANKKNPGYDRKSHVNDIELVTMERDVEFTRYIRPACLPFGFENENFENAQMTIIGWGDTFHRSLAGNDVPLAADIKVIPKSECRVAYRSEPQVPFDESQFCVGQGSKDACQGDSGGPLLYSDLKKRFKYFVMGVVSFGVECANPNFPGVYTYLPSFLTWITDNL